MKNTILLLIIIFLCPCGFAQSKTAGELAPDVEKTTYTYAEKDSFTLKLDKYRLNNTAEKQPCIFFVFGGGFKNGVRDGKGYMDYFDFFVRQGFTVISIDYRLGLKNAKGIGITNYKPLKQAIGMAVEDLFDATAFAINHAKEWNVDTSGFIITGSSAGAVTALQAEYENRNKLPSALKRLPETFNYAGVVSFAGAIFSTDGGLKWKNTPCPVYFFHGEKDKTVPYNKIRFFKLGFFGSKNIAGNFRKKGFSYVFASYKDAAHEVSSRPMHESHQEILQFIRTFVLQGRKMQMDLQVNELDKKKPAKKESYKDLYK